jgi:hypothetical protein
MAFELDATIPNYQPDPTKRQADGAMIRIITVMIALLATSAAQADWRGVGSSISGPSDVTTSGALDRGATESLTRSGIGDRSNTNLNPSDPRIGQNPRDAMGSIDKVDRSDRNSVINRNRW